MTTTTIDQRTVTAPWLIEEPCRNCDVRCVNPSRLEHFMVDDRECCACGCRSYAPADLGVRTAPHRPAYFRRPETCVRHDGLLIARD